MKKLVIVMLALVLSGCATAANKYGQVMPVCVFWCSVEIAEQDGNSGSTVSTSQSESENMSLPNQDQ